MTDLITTAAQHPQVAFWVGVFVLIGLAKICNTVVRLVRAAKGVHEEDD